MKKSLLFLFVMMFALQAQAASQDLINSVKSGDLPRLMELLNNGEDVNGTDANGTTALHYAVAYDNADMTQILLSYGADLSIANAKGWTPLKIAEKKNLKNVTPILVQYLQLQKTTHEDQTEIVEQEIATPEGVVQEVVAQEVSAPVEVVTPASAPVADVVPAPVAPLQAAVEEKVVEVVEAESVPQNDYQKVVDEAAQAVIDARTAQTKAEAEAKILADELKSLKAEKAELENKLAQKDDVKSAEETKKSDAVVAPKEPAKEAKEAKPAPKQVKPVLQKKPVYKAPQPVVKKIVIKPSNMVEGIYAGDEEIVYCLDYLGNGENENMKRAAGYFAASASISENRYKQIVDKANKYFTEAGDAEMTKRDNECSKIITPSDKNKQNQIVRSMNKSVGY